MSQVIVAESSISTVIFLICNPVFFRSQVRRFLGFLWNRRIIVCHRKYDGEAAPGLALICLYWSDLIHNKPIRCIQLHWFFLPQWTLNKERINFLSLFFIVMHGFYFWWTPSNLGRHHRRGNLDILFITSGKMTFPWSRDSACSQVLTRQTGKLQTVFPNHNSQSWWKTLDICCLPFSLDWLRH